MQYRLESGTYGRMEGDPPGLTIYRTGDVVELTAAEAASLGGRAVPVDEASTGSGDDGEAPEATTARSLPKEPAAKPAKGRLR